MGHSHWELCVAVTLFFLWGAVCSPSCPSPCLCQGGSVIKCSSVGPALPPLHLPATVTILDLSQNALSSLPLRPYGTPLPQLTHLHLGHNQLTHLSICKTPPTEQGPCESWAPTLQLLSAERNRLQRIPQGLCGTGVLHTLDLSYNSISTLWAQDLQGCAHLRELHLQHNRISTITPTAFGELQELRVLDLSSNALSSFPALAYLSLHSLGTQVQLSNNPWRCDCRLQALRSWMGVAQDGPPWQVVCGEPPEVAGRALLYLQDTDLTCDAPVEGVELHQEVTAYPGAEILLPCWVSDQDLSRAFWRTPNGSVQPVSAQHHGALLIQGVSEQDQGLYVCISGPNQEPTSMFTVHVRSHARGGAEQGSRGGDRTQSDLTLAVCLSVFLTFIAAFVLGVLARPLLDILWGKIQAWRHPTASRMATPCENQGFSEREVSEEQGQAEREVSEEQGQAGRAGLEGTSLPYYITVLPESGGSQAQSKGTEPEWDGLSGTRYENTGPTRAPAPQPAPRQGQRPQGEGLSPWEGGVNQVYAGGTGRDQSDCSPEEHPSHISHTVEFEPIPDPRDLGIEQLSTSGSEQSNHDLSPKPDPDRDLEHDPDHDPDPDLEHDPDPDRDLEHDPGHHSDPLNSREDFMAGKLTGTRPMSPAWRDSPWEPGPPALHAPPPNGIQPDLDPELWNDSGESFEFTDALPELVTSESLAKDLKDGPRSPFNQTITQQQDSPDPALLWAEQEKGTGHPFSSPGWDPPPGLGSSEQCKLTPESTALTPETTALTPESTALSPESTALTPENTALTPETTALTPETTALTPETTALTPESTALTPETTALTPETTALTPETTALTPETTALTPENTALTPETTALTPESTALTPETTALTPESTALTPETTALTPENTALTPETTALSPESTVMATDRAWLDPGELTQTPFPPSDPHCQLTGARTAGAPWVIHEGSQADMNMEEKVWEDTDVSAFEAHGAWPLVADAQEVEFGMELWSNVAGAQDRRFGETGPVSPQHPAPASPPYPRKPRRSFNWHTALHPHQHDDTPTPLHPHQHDTALLPPQHEDTLTALHAHQHDDTPTPPHPHQLADMQGEWPVPVGGPWATPSQGSQKQDWRKGGLFSQKKRAMDTFAPSAPATPLPGSTHLLSSTVAVETVTVAAGESSSGWFPLTEAEGVSAGGGEEGHMTSVTSDPASCLLIGSWVEKGSEA